MAQSAGESAAQATIASLRRKMQQIESGGAPMASASSAAVLGSAPAGIDMGLKHPGLSGSHGETHTHTRGKGCFLFAGILWALCA